MSILTTNAVLDFIIKRENDEFKNKLFGRSDKEFYVIELLNSDMFVTFLWRDLRNISSASCHFGDLEIRVKSCIGRVMVHFQMGDDWVSFLGCQEGYGASIQGCKIHTSSVNKMVKHIESFANAFTKEMFLIDESLKIG